MAIDLMLNRNDDFLHELRHDLESLLYVILWICTSMDGVGVERRQADPHFMDVPLRTWFDKNANIRDLGYRKLAHVVDSERAILDNFPPFWNSFKPFIRQLLSAFFPIHPIAGCPITPKAIISILKKAAAEVDKVADEPEAATPYESDAGAATFNQIFSNSTSHSHLNQVKFKRPREEEISQPQRSKKGKTTVINFQNWSSSMDGFPQAD
jgi:hypothetical protein